VDRTALGSKTRDGLYNVQELGDQENSDSDLDVASDDDATSTATSGMYSFFQRITGQKALTEQDLEPVMSAMKEHLVKKNVAAHIADHLCKSVTEGMIGQRLGTFKSKCLTNNKDLCISWYAVRLFNF
jgi:signal recognition particle receptor subunit alpha